MYLKNKNNKISSNIEIDHIKNKKYSTIENDHPSYKIKIKLNQNQYSLTQNYTEPIKNSPPNDFLVNLQKRIFNY
jgi:hypothetical protein